MTDGTLSWFHGSCHCGRVRFEVLAAPTSLSQCNCSLCSKKGALYVKVRELSELRISAGESELSSYRAQHPARQALLLSSLRHPPVSPPAARSRALERQRALPRRLGRVALRGDRVRRAELGSTGERRRLALGCRRARAGEGLRCSAREGALRTQYDAEGLPQPRRVAVARRDATLVAAARDGVA
jgi:hypothetical protein